MPKADRYGWQAFHLNTGIPRSGRNEETYHEC